MNEVTLTSNFEPDASTYRWTARGVNQLTRFNKLSSLPFWMPNNVTRHHQFRLILLRGMEIASSEAEDDLGVVLELIPPPSSHALPTESDMSTLKEQSEEHDEMKNSRMKEDLEVKQESTSTNTAQVETSKLTEIDRSKYPQGCTLTVKVFSPYTYTNNKEKLQELQTQKEEKPHAEVQKETTPKESNNETLHLVAEATESANIDGENLQVCIPHLLSASTIQRQLELFTNRCTYKDSDVNTKDASSEEHSKVAILELVIEVTIIIHVNIIAEHVTRSLGSLWNSVTTSMSQIWTHGTQLIHNEREEFAGNHNKQLLVALSSSETNTELTQNDKSKDVGANAPVMNEADSHVSEWLRSRLAKTVIASTAESLFANALSTIQHVVDVNSSTNATNQNTNTYYSDEVVKNVGKDTSLFTSDANTRQKNELPWNDTPTKWIGRENGWKELIGTRIINDDNTFLYGPPETCSQDHKALILQMGLPYKVIMCDYFDNVCKWLPVYSGLLTNEALSKKRYELVPRKVDEENFWRNYFWKVKCLSLCENEEAVKLLLSILNAPNNSSTNKYDKCTDVLSTNVHPINNTNTHSPVNEKNVNDNVRTTKKGGDLNYFKKIERELVDANEAADLLKEYLDDMKRTEIHYKKDNDEMLMINTIANECVNHLEEINNYIRLKEEQEQKEFANEQRQDEANNNIQTSEKGNNDWLKHVMQKSEVYKKAQDMQSRLQELLKDYYEIKLESEGKSTNSMAEETVKERKDEQLTGKDKNVDNVQVNTTNNNSTTTNETENDKIVQKNQMENESEKCRSVNETSMLTVQHDDKTAKSVKADQTNQKNVDTKIDIKSNITFAKMPWEEEEEEDEDNGENETIDNELKNTMVIPKIGKQLLLYQKKK